jgi:hypothetical protein
LRERHNGVAAENLGRRWIAIDCGKFAVHITRKRLIEASARPVRRREHRLLRPARRMEGRVAGQPVRQTLPRRDGRNLRRRDRGRLHLSARQKGKPLGPRRRAQRPVADAQVEAIVKEAAATDTRAVDILSADIPIDWNKSDTKPSTA